MKINRKAIRRGAKQIRERASHLWGAHGQKIGLILLHTPLIATLIFISWLVLEINANGIEAYGEIIIAYFTGWNTDPANMALLHIVLGLVVYAFYIVVWCTVFKVYDRLVDGVPDSIGRIYWIGGWGLSERLYGKKEKCVIYYNASKFFNVLLPLTSLTKLYNVPYDNMEKHFMSIKVRENSDWRHVYVSPKKYELEGERMPQNDTDIESTAARLEQKIKVLVHSTQQSTYANMDLIFDQIHDSTVIYPEELRAMFDRIDKEQLGGIPHSFPDDATSSELEQATVDLLDAIKFRKNTWHSERGALSDCWGTFLSLLLYRRGAGDDILPNPNDFLGSGTGRDSRPAIFQIIALAEATKRTLENRKAKTYDTGR